MWRRPLARRPGAGKGRRLATGAKAAGRAAAFGRECRRGRRGGFAGGSDAGDIVKKEPKSRVLFLTICSLTKARDGEPDYDDGQGIAAALPDFKDRLLERREEVRRFVKSTTTVDWQGVPLSQLEFNSDLRKGADFGGRHTSAFMPAIHRYQGRFFQALGEEGKKRLCESQHRTLFLSGLYGLLRPLEHIQLYSCPLLAEISKVWRRDSLLTELLREYVRKDGVRKIFDLTALEAYRDLVDWQSVSADDVEVLHCFDTMGPGDYALTSFG